MRRTWIALVAAFCAAHGVAAAPEPSGGTRLGSKDGAFTINGAPVFLVGASYYGGLGASDATRAKDLTALRKHGFNWIRVWATWAAFENDVSAVDGEGAPRPEHMRALARLLSECDRLGMVVDVTLSRQNGATGPPRLKSTAALVRAAAEIASACKERRNWYLDAANERNIKDARFVALDEIAAVVRRVKEIDPGRLVTASHAGGDLGTREIPAYLAAGVDFLAPHRPRHRGSAAETGAWTRETLAFLRASGRVVPVHFQEPFRRGFAEYEPPAADFILDLAQAYEAGAAGWCFHNGAEGKGPAQRPRRSFDLRDGPLVDQLDEEERKLFAHIREAWRTPRAPAK